MTKNLKIKRLPRDWVRNDSIGGYLEISSTSRSNRTTVTRKTGWGRGKNGR